MGRTAPNPSEAKTLEDGVVVPLGKPVDHSSSKVWLSLCFNTFFSPNHDYINSQIDFVWLFFFAGDFIVQRVHCLQYGTNQDAICDPSQIQLQVLKTLM